MEIAINTFELNYGAKKPQTLRRYLTVNGVSEIENKVIADFNSRQASGCTLTGYKVVCRLDGDCSTIPAEYRNREMNITQPVVIFF